MLAFIVGFTIINISLWGVLLIKFKKIFSTDSIIEKSRQAMNKMIADINRNAERDIELSKEATKRMRIMLADAEKSMENFRQATDRLRDMIAEADRISRNHVTNEPVVNINLKGNGSILENASSGSSFRNSNHADSGVYGQIDEQVDPNAVYELNLNGYADGASRQKKSFEQNSGNSSIMKDETKITSQGTAYKEVPVIKSRYFNDFNTMSSRIPLSEKVQKLFNQGMDVEEIAAALSCSITEVQLIIDML